MDSGKQAPQAPSVFPPIAPFSFTLGPGNALRKAKAVQNCSACRRRKTKCDRLWPCTPCKDRGEANLCEQYVKEPSDRPTGYTHVLDTSILANRVQQLENVLSRLITRVDKVEDYNDLLYEFKDPLPTYRPNKREGDEHDGRDSKRQSTDHKPSLRDHRDLDRENSASASGHTKAASIAPSNISQDIISPVMTMPPLRGGGRPQQQPQPGPSNSQLPTQQGTPGSQIMGGEATWMSSLNRDPGPYGGAYTPSNMDFLRSGFEPASKAPSAHEHDAALALEGMALGRELHNAIPQSRDEQNNNEPTPGSPITFSSFVQSKKIHKPSGGLKSFPAASRLPSIIVGKYVINHYLENVDFRWRCLHRPTFERQLEDLSQRLRHKSTDFYRDELSTLALYASCLAVGVHFLDDDGYRDLNLNEEQAEQLAATCWEVSYQALEASDWMQVHDIRSVRTIIIAGVYLSSIRRANQHWTLLGSATKVAMALGFGSVPDEQKILNGEVKRVPHRWRSTIDREVARRVWYCLLELDWLFSMEYGFVYLISPEIHQTTEPANVNDVDIKPDEPVVSLPPDQYTDMSYFLQRLKLFYPFQGVVLKARKAGRMRYAFVQEANAELQRAVDNMPAFYRDTDGSEAASDAVHLYRIKRESIALSEGADLRLMRLHRYYFSEACQNPRYLLSKQTCLSCARRLLESKARHGNLYSNTNYWAHTYCIFASSVVCIIYLHYALPQEVDDYKRLVESGVEQLKSLTRRRASELGEAGETLLSLMNVQLSRRDDPTQPENLKRGLNELETDAWEGFLPPDLLARLNGGVFGSVGGAGEQTDTFNSQTGDVVGNTDMGFSFDNLLDDLQFNEGNFMVL